MKKLDALHNYYRHTLAAAVKKSTGLSLADYTEAELANIADRLSYERGSVIFRTIADLLR